MQIVMITALGVGGATIFGAIIGFLFKNISQKFSDIVLSAAAGVMLAASIIGLILPALEYGGRFGFPITAIGIFCGAALIFTLDKLLPYIYGKIGQKKEFKPDNSAKIGKILLFVLAIAIHNFPEGIAAGVGFGTGDINDAITLAVGIALQNVPEGMVIIGPMLSAGISPARTLFYACLTGVIEIIGTVIGYFAVTVSVKILPFMLAFAGGTMLYVISHEIIPETHSSDGEMGASFALLFGFCLMLAVNFYI